MDKLARYFVCYKFLLPCSVHRDINGTENKVISIPASYCEVLGSNTGQEAGSAVLMFRDFLQSLTKKFRGSGDSGGVGGSGGGEGGGAVGCGDMMIIVVIIIIIIHLSPALKKCWGKSL